MILPKRIKVLLGVITVLFAFYFIRDWFVFYQCGAVEQCLADSSYVQHYTKFATTVLIAILAIAIGKDCLGRRDHRLLLTAMGAAFLADICFKLLHNAKSLAQFSVEFMLMGVCFFIVFQSILIYRFTRKNETDNSIPWIILVPFASVLVLFDLRLLGVFETGLVPTIIVYGTFLTCALFEGLLVSRYGYFPQKNASLIRLGMILFYLGDVCVGFSLATGDDHSTQEVVATVANNLVWFFYVPALLMLVLSGIRKK